MLGLAVAGCSADQATQPATPAPSRPAAFTQVLTFQAYDDSGLLPNLVRVATISGTCPGGSAVHTGRADAWRCGAGETAFDPCFANRTGEELACVPDPWTRDVTVVRPVAALGRAGSNRTDPGLPPWFLELADGTRCGRTPPSTYRCGTGADAGDPDTSQPVWTVERAATEGGTVREEVRTAWYRLRTRPGRRRPPHRSR